MGKSNSIDYYCESCHDQLYGEDHDFTEHRISDLHLNTYCHQCSMDCGMIVECEGKLR